MHAEVLCRRAFISFVFKKLLDLSKDKSIEDSFLKFDQFSSKYYWNEELDLIFYTSQSPCKMIFYATTNFLFLGGDASICKFILNTTCEGKKRRICDSSLLAAGRETDLLGILRTKPGRADCSFASSLSCSDKICIWNILGIQGALLSRLVKPIYLNYVLIGEDYDLDSVYRALICRTSDFEIKPEFMEKGFKNVSKYLAIFETEGLSLKKGISDETSTFWHQGLSRVGKIVLGFKKGSKRPIKGKSFGLALQSPLSRNYFFENYFKHLKIDSSESLTVEKCKAEDYQQLKKMVFEHGPFKEWIVSCDEMKKFRNAIKMK